LLGQQQPNGQAKILTVCEVIGDLSRYADTVVAVVGRLESSVSLTDHYSFLSQDRCQHPVITHGHVWSDKIQVWEAWEAGMPKPPSDRPKLEQSVIASKLSVVRRTTKVRPLMIVYGRIVKVPDLNEDCGPEGCGGDNVPLVIIAEPYNIHGLRDNGTLLPEDK
jgi:hypothetical protein